MRFLIYRMLMHVLRRLRRCDCDPYAVLLAETGLTHGEREALLPFRRDRSTS
jgi:hypothetical protein